MIGMMELFFVSHTQTIVIWRVQSKSAVHIPPASTPQASALCTWHSHETSHCRS